MLERAAPLVLLGAVVALPFLLRPREHLLDPSGEPLVIVTPHAEPIRYEFARAFRAHMRTKGRKVTVDWRTPGGANEIARFVTSEYQAAFERHWTHSLGRPWTPSVASSFANPKVSVDPANSTDESLARRTFLASNVGIGIDLAFGGGSPLAVRQAAAGWLVDSRLVDRVPELSDDGVIPEAIGGTPFRDPEGRWMGTCLSTFGICFNRDALTRLGIDGVPSAWSDLASPAYFGQLALADPTKSGSVAAAFEVVIQDQMNRRAAELTEGAEETPDLEGRARRDGWDRAMRLIRRIGANARYFSDAAPKIALDIATGDAAAGMCIDFYGRFQSEAAHGGPSRIGFAMPRGGTSIDPDAIGLLRGAPHRELALDFMEFVLSLRGQKIWDFKVGTPDGPERSALRRLPIRRELYEPMYDAARSDPGEHPYDTVGTFAYHPSWTGPLSRAIPLIIRIMCIDTEADLRAAYGSLVANRFPTRATALFDDVGLVDYAAASGPIRTALGSGNPIDEIEIQNRLLTALRNQYRTATELAKRGE